ncbi:MAG: DNA polymerase IV, partial [Lachnospiraceae bacterium]|nr:DNA polymerase IV [Lachnospiraceae bacterium]
YQHACKVFDELWDGTPIRHLGVHAGRIRDYDFYQMDLFAEMDYEKWEIVDRMVDDIRERYGIDMIKRAVLSKGPIDHMSGGISREKRDVDYSKISIM